MEKTQTPLLTRIPVKPPNPPPKDRKTAALCPSPACPQRVLMPLCTLLSRALRVSDNSKEKGKVTLFGFF